jgi:hypothetical protein
MTWINAGRATGGYPVPMRDDTIEIRAGVLRALYDYWRGKADGRRAPSRADIVPAEIKPLLRRIFLVDVVGTPPRFRFRLVGTEVVDYFGEEITGRYLDELDLDEVDHDIVADYRRVAAFGKPVCSRWTYQKHDGKLLRYERILLPLSSDGETIDMLLGGAFAEMHQEEKSPAR